MILWLKMTSSLHSCLLILAGDYMARLKMGALEVKDPDAVRTHNVQLCSALYNPLFKSVRTVRFRESTCRQLATYVFTDSIMYMYVLTFYAMH